MRIHDGEMTLTVKGGEPVRIGVGEYDVIEPGTVHKMEFETDCEYYAVTIPATSDWGAGCDTTEQRDEPPAD